MNFRIPKLPETFSAVTYGFAGISAAIIVIARLFRRPNLEAFPTVGSSGLLGSWWAGFKFLTNGVDVIQEGYETHRPAPFKVADLYGWIVILSKRDHLDELRRAPEDELSLVEATSDRFNTRYTLGDEVHDNAYHIAVIRSQLARNIGAAYPEIRDEIVTAFEDVLDLRDNEWKDVLALSAIQQVVCRTTNRLFVGLPLCRDPGWVDLNIQYAVSIVKTGLFIGLFPKFIRPLAVLLFNAVAKDTTRAVTHLGPLIEERLKHLKEYEDTREKPNDLIWWLIEESKGQRETVTSLATRTLAVGFPAIHTTSNNFTFALFYLAANPRYLQPLREEVEEIVEKEGWSKNALSKMHKVDSFLRECLRMEGGNSLSVMRKAMKDFTFSDGTCIPKGTTIGVATRSLHYDERFYENAHVFEPFRFADMREEGEGDKYQMVSTAIEYQSFGYGHHACPGRFFAASEMKTMLAHVVVTYDIKLEDGATCPCSLSVGTVIVPNPHAKVLFRKRVD